MSRTLASVSSILLFAAVACSNAPQEGVKIETSARPMVIVTAPAVTVAAAPSAETKPTESASKTALPAKPKKKHVSADLSVKKLLIGTGVERSSREPVGVSQRFKQGEFEKIVAYVEVANPGDDAEVVVSFDPPSNAASKGNVRLDIGTSPRWRTWASTKGVAEKGEWTAIVRSSDGRELARESFVVL